GQNLTGGQQMRTLYSYEYGKGEIRWGIPSWVQGPDTGERTAKWLYWGPSGRPARTSPEPPADVTVQLFLVNLAMGVYTEETIRNVRDCCNAALPAAKQ